MYKLPLVIGLISWIAIGYQSAPVLAQGADTRRLADLLASKNWKEADRETDTLMPKNLGCQDLTTINALWMRYSDDRFGYSPQREIWESREVNKNYTRFGNAVGWRRGNFSIELRKWAFSINDLITTSDADIKAPKGHLPFSGWQIDGLVRKDFGSFMSKLSKRRI